MVIPPNNTIGKSSSGTQSTQSGTVDSRQQQVETPNPKSEDSASSSEEVSLSPQAKQMAKLETAVQQSPSVDEAKVAALRDAIENGQYQSDSESISKKMLEMDSLF